MKTYLVVYFGSALVAMLLVPIVLKLAKRYNFVDYPEPRKPHQFPIPRVGGISFVAGSLALILPVFFLDNIIADSFRQAWVQFIALLAGASFIYVIGLIDDLRSIRGYVKLLCLIAAATFFCLSGATIRSVHMGSLITIHTGWAACPLTVCWIVGITICMGVIDGLDGLAAGIAAMVCSTLVVLSLWSGQAAMTVLMLALLGGITGFLIFNFYPAKIFMGDGGSLFLGFMIGAGSVICQAKTSAFVGLALPFLVLSMPILDTGLVFAFRGFIKRRSLFAPDNNHLHYRLLRHGLHHRSVVIIMYAITAISASLGIFMIRAGSELSVVLLMGGVALSFTIFACLQKGRYLKLIKGLKRNLIIAKHVREQKHKFETAQVTMRESISFPLWWEKLCELGEYMNFQRMSLLHRENGHYRNAYVCNASKKNAKNSRIIELNLPIGPNGSKEYKLNVRISTNDYLELSGHQIMLLTRFIDEFPMPQETPAAEEFLMQNKNSRLKEDPLTTSKVDNIESVKT